MVWGDCSSRVGGGEELKGLRMGVKDKYTILHFL